MKDRIRYGIVGLGFVGPHHVDAVRRLGFVDVVAAAGTDLSKLQQKTRELFIPRAYASYEELVADPEIDVVDVSTPTYLHFPIAKAAIAHGKHVIVDKPLSVSSAQARELRDLARAANVVHAVTFNYRYSPTVQQARAMIARGEIGELRFIHGHYFQDWLLHDTDFSWRLESDKGGRLCVAGDAGAHWYDLAEYMTGLRIVEVLADLHTMIAVRKRPVGQSTEAFASAEPGKVENYTVEGDDLSNILLRFDNGAVGSFSASQICAGHKNDLSIEFNGSNASIRWNAERSGELWVGRREQANQLLPKAPELFDASARSYAVLPGGHEEGWADAFRNLMRNIFTFIAHGKDPRDADGLLFPRFDEGFRNTKIVDAILQSHTDGCRWTAVDLRS